MPLLGLVFSLCPFSQILLGLYQKRESCGLQEHILEGDDDVPTSFNAEQALRLGGQA